MMAVKKQTDNEEIFANANINSFYWIYVATRDQIAESETDGINPEKYLWNRWSIKGLPDDKKELILLQQSIDETTPSWEKTPIQLLNIEALSTEEESELRQFIKEKSNDTISVLPSPNCQIDFKNIKWNKIADFDDFIFSGEMHFEKSEFLENARFRRCRFFKNSLFDGTKFHKDTLFSGSKFFETSSFLRVHFNIGINQEKNEKHTIKNYKTNFIETTFSKKTSFVNAEFYGYINFYGALFFGEINRFVNATFKKSPFFYGTIFKYTCNFADVTFDAVPNFTGCEFRGGLNITSIKAEFSDPIKGLKKLDVKNFEEMEEVNYEAARYTWQVFRESSKNSDDSQNEMKFLKKEFGVAKKNPSEKWVYRLLIYIYGILSGYGTSIILPVIWFVFQFLFFSFLYTSLLLEASAIQTLEKVSINDKAMLFSLDTDEQRKREKQTTAKATQWAVDKTIHINSSQTSSIDQTNCLGNLKCSAYNLSFIDSIIFVPVINKDYYIQAIKKTFGDRYLHNNYSTIRYFQKSAAIILFFLIGLGIRNRLRLR